MNPIKVFIQRPILTAMMILTLVVFGLFSFPRIGVDQFPEVDFPVVTVLVVLPGADPATMESTVAEPLEEALNTLSGVDTLRSINVENICQVIVRFDLDRDVDVAAQEVRDRVQATLAKLPREIEKPTVEKFDIGAAPIMTLALSGPLPVQRLTQLAEDDVKPALQRIQGVGAIELIGERRREITIEVDPSRLRAYGLAINDVVGAFRSQHVDVPGGRTAEATGERMVKLRAEAGSIDEMGELVIASPRGSPIRLRDLANVIDGPAEARSAAALDGQPAIGLVVRKQSGANTVQVAESIQTRLEEMTKTLPPDVRLYVVNDGSKFIRSSVGAVQEDMLIGGALAVIIVLLFLRNWRSTIVSAVALPTSVIGTFAVMRALDFTFNIVTMLALTLSIGLLIDDAIVVIENIVRHLEKGKKPEQAAYDATREIALAVMAVTLAVVAVFVPVAFMEGLMGRFFYQFGITVAVAVLISFVVSITLTPALSAKVLREQRGEPGLVSMAIERVLGGLESLYRRVLPLLLRQRALTVAAAILLMAATVFGARGVNFTFIPDQDMSAVKIGVELPPGMALESTERELQSLAAQTAVVPGVTKVFTIAGAGLSKEVNKGELLVNLVPIKGRDYSQSEIKEHLREVLTPGPGVILTVMDLSPVSGGGNRPQQVQFNLRSNDWNQLLAAVEKTRAAMEANPGLVDVDSTYRSGKPQIDMSIDRDRAADLGIPAAFLGQALRAYLGRDKIADYRELGDTYDVKVRLASSVLARPTHISEAVVRAPSGKLVEMRAVTKLSSTTGPSQIERQAQMRQITLLADLRNYSLGEATDFLNDFAARELPPTVDADFEGMGRELGKAVLGFALALGLGIVLVYIILSGQFESLLHPFTIMLALPLGVIGAIAALLLSGYYMSMFAMIGIIMLMGLVTKNGILLVEFTNQLRRQGLSVRDALLEAGPIRLRPILMTTVAMIAGMVPVALARGDGAELRAPMAVVVIGGLITSTVLTLGVVPVVYSLLESARERLTASTWRPSLSGLPPRKATFAKTNRPPGGG